YNAAAGQTTLLTPNSIDAISTASPRVKIVGNALVTRGAVSINLRGTLYGTTHQRVSLDGTGSGGVTIGTPTTLITDL
ncbi:hypothetical protein, partial [Salmonella enterica]|uniref:hypothetical protein n=1 Tax=Salmonella enterica TaxID=28901 RepID=UPI003D283E43